MRNVVIVIVSLLLGIAAAIDVPADASVVITSEDGVVVGVGSLARGERLTLDLLEGFRGRARLLLVAAGGAVTVLVVDVVRDTLMVDGSDLLERLAELGFHELAITGDAAIAARATLLREPLLRSREEPGTATPPADAPPATRPPAARPPAAGPPAARPPAAEPPAAEPPAAEPPVVPPAAGPPATRPPAAGPPATRPPAAGPPASRPPAAGPPSGVPRGGAPRGIGPPLERLPVEPPAADGIGESELEAPDDE
jgi:hypothetical protein